MPTTDGYIGLFYKSPGLLKDDKTTVLVEADTGRVTTNLKTQSDNAVSTEVDNAKSDLEAFIKNPGDGDGVIYQILTAEGIMIFR